MSQSVFPDQLAFRHPWRSYQQRVLDGLSGHLRDRSLHVVAAPGSGKTVLGLEVVRRLGRPALVLAPTLTIRDQWVQRLVADFLPDGADLPAWVSTEVRAPGLLTVATYQALHAAHTGAHAPEPPEPEEEGAEQEQDEGPVPERASSQVIAALRARGIGTLVVDEAHHLRAEWWRTLFALRRALPQATVVALTATPPYDVPPAEWERYCRLCGPVDAEVSIPELVVARNLCPHQDYVHFSLPTAAESEVIRRFRTQVAALQGELVRDAELIALLRDHPWLTDPLARGEEILEEPEAFSALLVFLRAATGAVPPRALHLLGVRERDLPPLTPRWLERLLNWLLFTQREALAAHEATLARLERQLRRIGALERQQVHLTSASTIERTLMRSLSKLDSIVEIVRTESAALGERLRLVVLSDYIRAADLPAGPDDLTPATRLGVVPIFEQLRRAGPEAPGLAALSGSLVIVPGAVRERLLALAAAAGVAEGCLRLTPLPHDPGYLRVDTRDTDRSLLVQLMTRLFTEGGVRILVGTKSLLGEGWDAPAINALVLASFVGSYMLSNQMRGRAIRTEPGNPDKTANIWHLVCVEPGAQDPGEDFATLQRRFVAFPGPALDRPVIYSGLDRLGVGAPPYRAATVAAINARMIAHALDRTALRAHWDQALVAAERHQMAEEVVAPAVSLPRGFVFARTLRALVLQALWTGGSLTALTLRGVQGAEGNPGVLLTLAALGLGVGALGSLPTLLRAGWLALRHGDVAGSLGQVAAALLDALCQAEVIQTPRQQLRPVTRAQRGGAVYCTLQGGTTREATVFLNALGELLDPVQNPRYLLLRHSPWRGLTRTDYHAVPTELGRRREDAAALLAAWQRRVGPAELIYTRNPEGRRMLLRARAHALSSALAPHSQRLSRWQ